MELEELLALLQAYGVTSYADKEYKLELTHLGHSRPVDEEEFAVDFSQIEFKPDFEPSN